MEPYQFHLPPKIRLGDTKSPLHGNAGDSGIFPLKNIVLPSSKKDGIKRDKLYGTTGFCKNLRFAAVLCENLRFRNAVLPRKAKSSKNQRKSEKMQIWLGLSPLVCPFNSPWQRLNPRNSGNSFWGSQKGIPWRTKITKVDKLASNNVIERQEWQLATDASLLSNSRRARSLRTRQHKRVTMIKVGPFHDWSNHQDQALEERSSFECTKHMFLATIADSKQQTAASWV